MSFDYTATDTPDDVVRSVAAEINGGGLKPLSDDERLEREIWREQQAWRAEQRDAERRQRQAEQAAEAESIARAEQAAEIAESNRRLRLERQERINRDVQQRELADLRIRSAAHEGWQRGVENAARNAVRQRYTQELMGELDALTNPPQPATPPEPEVIETVEGSDQLGTSDFNPKLWMQKPRSWW
jgi:hypothetical protein